MFKTTKVRPLNEKQTKKNNCIVCALWPLLVFMPNFCIHGNCYHKNSKSSPKTIFGTSKLHLLIFVLITLLSFQKLFNVIMEFSSAQKNSYILFAAHELINISGYITVLFSSLYLSNKKLDSIQCHQNLLDCIKGLTLLLNEKDVRRFRNLSLASIGIAIVHVLLYAFVYLKIVSNYDDIFLLLSIFVGEIIDTYILFMHTYTYYIDANLHILFLRKAYKKIYCSMRKKLEFISITNSRREDIDVDLRNYRVLYLLIMKNFRISLAFHSPSLFIIYTILILFLIFNIFFILLIIMWTYFDTKFLLILINSYLNLVMVIYFAIIGERISNTVSYSLYY